MSRRSPSISRIEYTSYEFTNPVGIDYNYDPSSSTTLGGKPAFDPYTDIYNSPPTASPIRDEERHRTLDEDNWNDRDYGTSGSGPNLHSDQRSRQTPTTSAPPPPPIPTTPSPEYIKESQKLSSRLSSPTAARKLLILDLNGTLVYRTPHARRDIPRAHGRRRGNSRQAHSQHHIKHPYQTYSQPLHGPEDAPNYSGQSYAHYQPYSQPTDQYHVEFHPHNQYSESPIPYQHPQYTPHPQYHPHLHPHREAYPQTHPPPDPADPYADPTAPRGLRNVYTRPYMGSFQEYLFHPSTRAWLDTMVWSSAQPHSVNDMVDKAFGSRKGELIAVWARDTLGLEEKDYYRKTQTTKDLARPWAKLSISPSSTSTRTTDPDTPLGHSAHTTLLLDDSPLKAHLQPWNHLCIREYSGSLRQADIQCRTREERKKQASATTAQQDKNTDALVPAVDHTDPTQNQTPADIPSSPEHPKKRKRPKKNKPAVPAIELEDVLRLGLGGYDPTLLAVVGVLDVVKWEGNVAGWMRAGGLSATASTLSEDEEEGKAEGEGREEVVGSGGGKTRRGLVEVESVSVESIASGDEKRRRVSGERDAEGSAGEAAVGVSSPATSPPTSASASPPTTSISTPTVSPTMSTAPALAAKIAPSTPDTNIGDTGQWFEDHTALRYWVRRGVRALEGMGIQIVSGVVGQA